MKLEKGCWIICGYGCLGQVIQKWFENKGLEIVIIELELEVCNIYEDYCVVKGLGIEVLILLEVGIYNVVGIVVGMVDDVNNLLIVFIVRELKLLLKLVVC